MEILETIMKRHIFHLSFSGQKSLIIGKLFDLSLAKDYSMRSDLEEIWVKHKGVPCLMDHPSYEVIGNQTTSEPTPAKIEADLRKKRDDIFRNMW